MAIVPVPPTMLTPVLPRVINPLYVAAAPEFINAPLLEIPVPLSVNASAVPNVKPAKSSAAPLVTEVPAAIVPKGVLVASPTAPSFRVPALTVVSPVKVPAALIVSVPAPSLVRVPAPVVMPVVLIVVLPLPPIVRPVSVPVIPPVRVKVSLSELILVVPAKVIAPAQELLPLIFLKAPSLDIPVPLSERVSAPTEIFACSCKAALVATVTPPAVVPVA